MKDRVLTSLYEDLQALGVPLEQVVEGAVAEKIRAGVPGFSISIQTYLSTPYSKPDEPATRDRLDAEIRVKKKVGTDQYYLPSFKLAVAKATHYIDHLTVGGISSQDLLRTILHNPDQPESAWVYLTRVGLPAGNSDWPTAAKIPGQPDLIKSVSLLAGSASGLRTLQQILDLHRPTTCFYWHDTISPTTLQEAYNLMERRFVFKKEVRYGLDGKIFNTWIGLEPDRPNLTILPNGHLTKYYPENALPLERTLSLQSLKERESFEGRKTLVTSLQRGDLVPVTLLKGRGEEETLHIMAHPGRGKLMGLQGGLIQELEPPQRSHQLRW